MLYSFLEFFLPKKERQSVQTPPKALTLTPTQVQSQPMPEVKAVQPERIFQPVVRTAKWQLFLRRSSRISKRVTSLMHFFQMRQKGKVTELMLNYVGQEPSTEEIKHLSEKIITLFDGNDAWRIQEWQEAFEKLLNPFYDIHGRSAWFNDSLIDPFFEYLAEKYSDKKTVCLTSLLYKQETFVSRLQELTRKWLAGQDLGKSRFLQLYKKLKEAELILWPVALGGLQGTHWTLLAIRKIVVQIDKEKRNSFSLNALDGMNLAGDHLELFRKGKAILTALRGELAQDDVKTESWPVPRQNNTEDCGPVVCCFAEKICQGELLTQYKAYQNIKCNYQQMRPYIGQVLYARAKAKLGNMEQNNMTKKKF